jgi:hypothetical protein
MPLEKMSQAMPWLIPLLISLITFSAYAYVSMVKVGYLEKRCNMMQEQMVDLHDKLIEVNFKVNKVNNLCCSEIKEIER